MAKKLVLSDRFGEIETVAGADQAFLGNRIISAIVVCSFKTLEPIEKVHSFRCDIPVYTNVFVIQGGSGGSGSLEKAGEKA